METEATTLCGLKREDFQKDINGKKTDLYILRNSEGLEVAITNYGGAIVAIMVPDRDGNVANVIQGHDNIEDCINSPEPFLSTLVGRYGNRICKGRFVMNGKDTVHIYGNFAHTDRNNVSVIGNARDFAEHGFLNFNRRSRRV